MEAPKQICDIALMALQLADLQEEPCPRRLPTHLHYQLHACQDYLEDVLLHEFDKAWRTAVMSSRGVQLNTFSSNAYSTIDDEDDDQNQLVVIRN